MPNSGGGGPGEVGINSNTTLTYTFDTSATADGNGYDLSPSTSSAAGATAAASSRTTLFIIRPSRPSTFTELAAVNYAPGGTLNGARPIWRSRARPPTSRPSSSSSELSRTVMWDTTNSRSRERPCLRPHPCHGPAWAAAVGMAPGTPPPPPPIGKPPRAAAHRSSPTALPSLLTNGDQYEHHGPGRRGEPCQPGFLQHGQFLRPRRRIDFHHQRPRHAYRQRRG